MLKYCCHESALNIGASLTFVGEVREVHVPFVLSFFSRCGSCKRGVLVAVQVKLHVILFLFVM